MTFTGIETRDGMDQAGPNRTAHEAARLREDLRSEAAVAIGPQALTASMRGETVARKGFVMQALGEETPTVVPERTIDNFWLHKPA